MRQMVAIARAVDIEARVLILDEPTSSLDAGEVAQLFKVMRTLKGEGIAILFVSHFLDQIYEIADRMTILRNRRRVGEYLVSELSQVELVGKMIGQELKELERLHGEAKRFDAPLVEARELGRPGAIEPFTLTIHEGEVVGLAGCSAQAVRSGAVALRADTRAGERSRSAVRRPRCARRARRWATDQPSARRTQ
ncbi:hypothetical protein GCM10020219_055950 [Nonomuraea dietziae]